LSNVQNEIKE